MQKVVERFLSYIAIDSQSDPESESTPSTEKQWNIARKLAKELEERGWKYVRKDGKT